MYAFLPSMPHNYVKLWKNHTARDFGVISRHMENTRREKEEEYRRGDQTERERSRVPIAFKPLKHRRISMWIRLLEYTGSRHMHERMYVNMPTLSEASLIQSDAIEAPGGRHDGFRSIDVPACFKDPKIALSRVVCPVIGLPAAGLPSLPRRRDRIPNHFPVHTRSHNIL